MPVGDHVLRHSILSNRFVLLATTEAVTSISAVPHIALPPDLPGITSAFAFRPETAKPLRELAETLLRGPNTLTSGERETIAAFVSSQNDCHFCQASHSAAAAHHMDGSYAIVDAVKHDPASAPITPKLRALLTIAGKVRESGKNVTAAEVDAARAAGATDLEIHDTVLIAAAFCMYNRYVDGLATLTPTDPAVYDEMGQRMAREGYGPFAVKVPC
jgi:uncharacterized peroxidase-related enzyme